MATGVLANLDAEGVASLAQKTLYDRVVGTLVGSALGDAIGLYTEFLTAERARQEYPDGKFTLAPTPTPFARDFHRLKHRPGEWTDDTDHALLILLSYLHNGQATPQDLAERLLVWVQMGLRALDTPPLGLGNTVGAIVRSKLYLENSVAAAHDRWENGGYEVAPNGSLMRTHPLGLISLNMNVHQAMELAARMSMVTHVDPRCIVACMIGTALVRGLVRREVTTESDIDAVVDLAATMYTDDLRQTFIAEGPFVDDEPRLDVDELKKHTATADLADLALDGNGSGRGIGYVYKTLGSGVVLLRQAMRKVTAANGSLSAQFQAFEPLITNLVMHGGDADTNACFAGALLGAYLGYGALPAHWRDYLRHGQWLLTKADSLSVVLGVKDGTYDGKLDKDTSPDGGRGFLTEHEMDGRFMELQARMAQDEREYKAAKEEREKGSTQWDRFFFRRK